MVRACSAGWEEEGDVTACEDDWESAMRSGYFSHYKKVPDGKGKRRD